MSDKIIEVLEKNPCKAFSPKELSMLTGLSRKTVHLHLNRLMADRVERVGYGMYRLIKIQCITCHRGRIIEGYVRGVCEETGEAFQKVFKNPDYYQNKRIPIHPKGPRNTKGENKK